MCRRCLLGWHGLPLMHSQAHWVYREGRQTRSRSEHEYAYRADCVSSMARKCQRVLVVHVRAPPCQHSMIAGVNPQSDSKVSRALEPRTAEARAICIAMALVDVAAKARASLTIESCDRVPVGRSDCSESLWLFALPRCPFGSGPLGGDRGWLLALLS